MSHVIVLGNEKGGSGKSTTAMHLITALARADHAVGAIDLDLRQSSLFRYLDNRLDYMNRHDLELPMPRRIVLEASTRDSRTEAEAEDQEHFQAALADLSACDYIVVDCPGSYSTYSPRPRLRRHPARRERRRGVRRRAPTPRRAGLPGTPRVGDGDPGVPGARATPRAES